MNKETSDIVREIETYLKEVAVEKATPEEIGFNMTKLLIDHELVSDEFAIEVIPLNDSYMLRSRTLYTTNKIGAMPSFCRVCGKLMGKTTCRHEHLP